MIESTPLRVEVGFVAAFALVAVFIGGIQASNHQVDVIRPDDGSFLQMDGARWSTVEVHADPGSTVDIDATARVETPPKDIRAVFSVYDADWDPVGSVVWRAWTTGDAPVARVSGPMGTQGEVRGPALEEEFNTTGRSENLTASARISGNSGGSPAAYFVTLTDDDDPLVNVTASGGGRLGNYTAGVAGVHSKEVAEFDDVGFHVKTGDQGPSVTRDARETLEVADSLIGFIELAPGGGEGGWSGPGSRGMACDQTLDSDCDLRGAIEGPGGEYGFHVDRDSSSTYFPWILVADVERP